MMSLSWCLLCGGGKKYVCIWFPCHGSIISIPYFKILALVHHHWLPGLPPSLSSPPRVNPPQEGQSQPPPPPRYMGSRLPWTAIGGPRGGQLLPLLVPSLVWGAAAGPIKSSVRALAAPLPPTVGGWCMGKAETESESWPPLPQASVTGWAARGQAWAHLSNGVASHGTPACARGWSVGHPASPAFPMPPQAPRGLCLSWYTARPSTLATITLAVSFPPQRRPLRLHLRWWNG